MGLRRARVAPPAPRATCSNSWPPTPRRPARSRRRSPLASPGRARSAARGRSSRAHPAADRGWGDRRRAPGVRRPRAPPADHAPRAALARDPPAPRDHPRPSGRSCSRRDRDPPPLPAPLARRERSPFVGREDALGWLRSEWSRRSARSGPARGDRRRSGHRQDAADQRACARGSRGGRGGVARPLSRGAPDLLSAVRRGDRSLRRGGLAGGAAQPARHPPRRARPARPRPRRAPHRPARASRWRRGRPALPAVRGSRLPDREHRPGATGPAGAGGPALGGQADSPDARPRGALDPGRAGAGPRHVPRDGARRAPGLRAGGPAPRPRTRAAAARAAFTAGMSRR